MVALLETSGRSFDGYKSETFLKNFKMLLPRPFGKYQWCDKHFLSCEITHFLMVWWFWKIRFPWHLSRECVCVCVFKDWAILARSVFIIRPGGGHVNSRHHLDITKTLFIPFQRQDVRWRLNRYCTNKVARRHYTHWNQKMFGGLFLMQCRWTRSPKIIK